MEATYYPGCSLHGMAAEYDESLRAVCEALDVRLVELADWNCCGASSAHFLNDELAVRLPARNMVLADREGRDLLVPCSACFERLKHADKLLREDAGPWSDQPYAARAEVWHVNDFFHRPELLAAVKRRVARPLLGLAAVPYYGCLSQRPPKVTGAAAPENPVSMDALLAALGAEVRRWSYKTDCCGASLTLTRPDVVQRLSGRLLDAAREAGGECLVTDCPMCQSNLDSVEAELLRSGRQPGALPVFYVTELMALAFGDQRAGRWWKRHFVDPLPLLQAKGLWD